METSQTVEKALEIARISHNGQEYDHGSYYENHILIVVRIAHYLGLSETIKAACALHDVLEDTNIQYADLVNEIGFEVANLVYLVTDEIGRNRFERKMKTYPKIRGNSDAVLVKLCDRIANLMYSNEKRNYKKIRMYVEESEDFKEYLAVYQHMDKVENAWSWYELELERAKRMLWTIK